MPLIKVSPGLETSYPAPGQTKGWNRIAQSRIQHQLCDRTSWASGLHKKGDPWKKMQLFKTERSNKKRALCLLAVHLSLTSTTSSNDCSKYLDQGFSTSLPLLKEPQIQSSLNWVRFCKNEILHINGEITNTESFSIIPDWIVTSALPQNYSAEPEK